MSGDDFTNLTQLRGKTVKLMLPQRVASQGISWRVIGYGSGLVRLRVINNNPDATRRIHSVDYKEFKNYIDTGRLVVED